MSTSCRRGESCRQTGQNVRLLTTPSPSSASPVPLTAIPALLSCPSCTAHPTPPPLPCPSCNAHPQPPPLPCPSCSSQDSIRFLAPPHITLPSFSWTSPHTCGTWLCLASSMKRSCRCRRHVLSAESNPSPPYPTTLPPCPTSYIPPCTPLHSDDPGRALKGSGGGREWREASQGAGEWDLSLEGEGGESSSSLCMREGGGERMERTGLSLLERVGRVWAGSAQGR